MNRKQKQDIIHALEACATMQDHLSRNTVVNDLTFKANIRRHAADRLDLANIVEACGLYPNGLTELLESLQFYEGDSFALQTVRTLILELQHPNTELPLVAPTSLVSLDSEPIETKTIP